MNTSKNKELTVPKERPKCNVFDGHACQCDRPAVFIPVRNGQDALNNGKKVFMCEDHSKSVWGGGTQCRLVNVDDYIS